MKIMLSKNEAIAAVEERLEYFQNRLIEFRQKTVDNKLERGEEKYVNYYTMEVAKHELLLSIFLGAYK